MTADLKKNTYFQRSIFHWRFHIFIHYQYFQKFFLKILNLFCLVQFFSHKSQPYSIYSISLQYKVWIICRTRFKTRNSCDAAGTSQTTNFFTLRVKNTYVYALNNLNSHFYSNDSKNFHTTQTTIFLIQIMLETYNEDTMQTTNFLILAERFKHTIYILQRQESVPRLNMENFMAQYTNETT